MPFSSDNKILLKETQTDEILSIFCIEQQIHQRSGTNGMVWFEAFLSETVLSV
jgi:hypothetical protein